MFFQWLECSSSRPSLRGDTDRGNRDGGDGGESAKHPRVDQSPDGFPHQRVSVVINDAHSIPQRVHQHQGNQLPRIVPGAHGATFTAGLCNSTALHNAKRHYPHKRHRCRHHHTISGTVPYNTVPAITSSRNSIRYQCNECFICGKSEAWFYIFTRILLKFYCGIVVNSACTWKQV